MVETLFLNMLFNGKMKAMPPKLLSDDERNIVIRPLAYRRETDVAKLAELNQYPIIPCNSCGSQENLQRQNIKQMLADWEKRQPGCIENIFNSIQNVSASQLADRKLFDFQNLVLDRTDEINSCQNMGVEISSTNVIEAINL